MAVVSRLKFSRRSFLKSAAAFAAPTIIPGSALGLNGAVSPSNRISLGLIGCGGHGAGWNLDQIFRNDDVQVVAVCDVDAERRWTAKEKVDRFFTKKMGRDYSSCSVYPDFRDLINRCDIDVVANCTPDHWHVIPALMAVKTGKDVICEKPLTLTVEEGRVLSDAVQQEDRVFQTASENRSIDSYIRMVELVRAWRIGKLQHIRVSLPGGNESRGEDFEDRQPRPVPEGFNYDMWLGQAPWIPFIPARCHESFRWVKGFSGGRLTDWGAHMIDLAQWANGSKGTGPVEVEGTGAFPEPEDIFDTMYEFKLLYRYKNGVTMEVVSEGPGIRFEGTDGWIGFEDWRGPLEASRPEILEAEIGPDEIHVYRPSEIVKRDDNWKGGEYRNFLDCVKSRKPCYAPAETGHRTISIAHIGNIAVQVGRKLRWDPELERFENDTGANELLSRDQREPWSIRNIDSWIT